MSRPHLLQLLGFIQNRATNAHRDIMTFSGFMSSLDELADYVLQQFRALTPDEKVRVLELAKQAEVA